MFETELKQFPFDGALYDMIRGCLGSQSYATWVVNKESSLEYITYESILDSFARDVLLTNEEVFAIFQQLCSLFQAVENLSDHHFQKNSQKFYEEALERLGHFYPDEYQKIKGKTQ